MYDFEKTKIVFDENSGDLNYINDKVCPRCQTSLSEFLRSGIVGCANCYKVFEKEIREEIFKKQGNVNHNGKVAIKHISKLKMKEKLEELEIKKQKAADEENYIEAESLKNQIEKLRGEIER